jgi:hypothetical protein
MRWISYLFTYSFQPHCGPGVDLVTNRNEYQEISPGGKGDRRVRLTILPPSVSRLSTQDERTSTYHNPMDLHGLLQDSFTFTLLWKNERKKLVARPGLGRDMELITLAQDDVHSCELGTKPFDSKS